MRILVINCFHWLGFHITDRLLDKGYRVDGMDKVDNELKEQLLMLVGRNAHFNHLSDSEENKDYDRVVDIGDEEVMISLNGAKTTVKASPIIGEWMPMDENGIFYKGNHVPFTELKVEDILDVRVFCKILVQLLQLSQLSSEIMLKTCQPRRDEEPALENSVYVRNNIPISESVNRLKSHYERFRNFYLYY